MNPENHINKRLKAFRKKIKITQSELAELLECNQATVAYYEKGKIEPSIEKLLIMSQTYNIDLNWLLTGQGSMFRGQAETEKIRLENEVEALKKENEKLYKDIKKLDDENKKLDNEINEIRKETLDILTGKLKLVKA